MEASLKMVLWRLPRKVRTYSSEILARYLYDPQRQGRTRLINRAQRERITRQTLHTGLSVDSTLRELIGKHRRMG